MRIQVMPKHMAELIAAGEVVERPASVVKELMENSIDAGATSVTVEIKGGGISYLRVTDNGHGIAAEDLPLAFQSHATSKIKTEDDLNKIATLGFRGEALASICAVSRVEVLTAEENAESGTCYTICGGEETGRDSAGCPKGTTIIVRDLFYNTPARMKFLKKDVTEGNYVFSVIDKTALSHPEISFKFIREGKTVLSTKGDGNLFNTIFSVFGKDFADGLIKTDYTLNKIHVWGYISKPASCRANRSMQYFFVSGRQVKTLTGMSALEAAYKNSVMIGKTPACVLNIDVDPASVDVNVHPAKTEVRFQNEKLIFDAVYYAAKQALDTGDTAKKAEFKPENVFKKPTTEQIKISDIKKSPEIKEFWQSKSVDTFQSEAEEKENLASPPVPYEISKKRNIQSGGNSESVIVHNIYGENNDLPDESYKNLIGGKSSIELQTEKTDESASKPFKVVGEIFKTYIIAEQGSDVLFVDKHAAHERMIYEQLKTQPHNDPQVLLAPVSVTLSKNDYNAVLENRNLLLKCGFNIEDFGAGTVRVVEYPMVLENTDIPSVIEETAAYLRENKKDLTPETLDWVYHNVACRAAVKAGTAANRYEQEKFIEKLLSMPEIRYCPHGRPVMISMSKYQFEKQFGRK